MTAVPERLAATAAAYDAVAVRYAEFTREALEAQPLDQAMLAAFAGYVRTSGGGPVAELGCGPGRIAAYLSGLGLDVSGIDLSPAMIDLSREAYPGLRFEVGSMDALGIADGELAGIVSWYSIIHAEPADVREYFAEFRRVLAPGGHLLVAFFDSGDGPLAVFDHKVAPAYRWPVGDLAALATASGFAELGRMLRHPVGEERFPRARLLLHRL